MSTAPTFSGKRVLVTGSGRGIGKGIAKAFVEAGASVLLIARSREELTATSNEFSTLVGKNEVLPIDLLNADAPAMVVREAIRYFGGLDIVVTNAGGAAQGGFLELPDEAWPEGFGLKMFANLRVIKAAWPHLKESRGSVVMIGGGTAESRTASGSGERDQRWSSRVVEGRCRTRIPGWCSSESDSTGNDSNHPPGKTVRKTC